MKIHLDYLEGRVEELENQNVALESEIKKKDRKIQISDDKFKLMKDEKES